MLDFVDKSKDIEDNHQSGSQRAVAFIAAFTYFLIFSTGLMYAQNLGVPGGGPSGFSGPAVVNVGEEALYSYPLFSDIGPAPEIHISDEGVLLNSYITISPDPFLPIVMLNFTVKWNQVGQGNISLSFADGSLTPLFGVTILDMVPPVPTAPTVSGSFCGQSILKRNNTPPNGVEWYWQNSNTATTSLGNDTTLAVDDGGTYYLRARRIGGSLWSAVSSGLSVTVNEIPQVPLILEIDGDIIRSCGQTEVKKPDNTMDVSYYWQSTPNDTFLDNDASSYYFSSDTTIYLRALNSNGCWNIGQREVVVEVLEATYLSGDVFYENCELAQISFLNPFLNDATSYKLYDSFWNLIPLTTGQGPFNWNITENGIYTIVKDNIIFNGESCTQDSIEVLVDQLHYYPNVDAGSDIIHQLNDGDLTLSGALPTGGQWIGENVSNGVLELRAPGEYTVTYQYQEGNSCVVSDDKNIKVTYIPEAPVTQYVCDRAELWLLNSEEGTMANGNIYEVYDSQHTKITAVEENRLWQVFEGGDYYARVLFLQPTLDFIASDTVYFEVAELSEPPVVEAGENVYIIEGTEQLVLSGMSPAGGVWSGDFTAIDETTINTLGLVPGRYDAIYSYENEAQCIGEDNLEIIVLPTDPLAANNYVSVYEIRQPNINTITGLNIGEHSKHTIYYDGIGRPMQEVTDYEPLNTALPKMVSIVENDQFGRQPVQHLPYTAVNDGSFNKQAQIDQKDYYLSQLEGVNDAMPYATTKLESSPRSLAISSRAAGQVWYEANREIKYSYTSNITEDKVNLFEFDSENKISLLGYYLNGELFRTTTTDEEGHAVIEFVNKLGQTVLKRVQAVESPNMTNYTLGEWADTYYVYDDFGNLRYVLPPEAVKEIGTPGSWPFTPSATLLNKWAFQYKYDHRNRMVEKKVPGAEPVLMIYDDRDRLVLTQDGEQRLQNQWLFTKYDALNRPITTGFYTHSAVDQSAMQTVVDAYYDNLSANQAWYETRGSVVHGYDNKSFPQVNTANDYLTVTYYDDYTFPHASSYSFVPELGNVAEFSQVKGQVTGTKTKTLDGSNTWLESVAYYDDRYRAIQSQAQTLIGGVDRVSNRYDFIGQVLETKTTHQPITSGPIQWTNLVNMTDNAGILTKTSGNHSWNADATSVQSIPEGTNGNISFTANGTNTHRMIGLSTTNANANWKTIDYAIYLHSTGTVQIRENGSPNRLTSQPVYADGDQFKIERLGNQIRYWHNDRMLREVAATYEALIVDLSVLNSGHSLNKIFIQKPTGTVSEENSITRKFEYDHAGRLLTATHQMNADPEVTLAENKYNELGELIEKNLHSEDEGSSFAQSIDYRYNIRGWLTSINNARLTHTTENDDTGQATDYWGMELGYNNPLSGVTAAAAFNGNISAVKWSDNLGMGGATDIKERAYAYTYDAMNRIKTANHSQYTSVWTPNNHFQLSGLNYDLNGNIETLTRKNQQGGTMDALTYTYTGNQLLRLADTGLDQGFKDGTNGGDDYLYDDNGNMTKDLNKEITSIEYNHLNLPTRVEKDANNYILYTYDATGIKLRQEVYEGGALTKTTDYIGEFIYENDTLQLIQNEEGRIVPDPATGNYDYEYALRDHLGNTRVMFTTNPKTIDFTLNYESNSADPDDETLFDNLQNVITADIHDRVDAGNESFNHQNVQALNGATNGVIGSVLTIPVGAGDKVSAEVYAKYLAPTGTNNPAAAVGSLVIAAITGSTGTNNYEGAINSGYGSGGTVTNLINANSSGTEPMAFINLLFLPDDVTGSITTDHFAFKQVTSASSNNQAILALDQPYEAPEAGYVVVYLSNESAQLTEVYFDDLKVTVEEHPVIETSDYYPFGLTHAGGFKRVTAKENRFKFSGKERIDDLDLGWDDFGARMYMSDIGRWGVMDNFADIYLNLSPYNYVANNPIILTDPDGNTIVDSEGNVVGIEFDDDGNITNITGTEDQSLMDLIRNTYADSDVGRESITTLNAEGTTYQINISEEGAIWESPDGGFGSVDGFSGPGQEFDVEINIFGNSTENTSDVSEENFDSFTVYDPYGDTQKVGKKKKQKIIDSVNSGEAAAQHGAHQQSLGNLTPDQLAKYNAARQADKNNPSLRSTNTLIYETANSTNRWDVKGETAGKIAVGTAHTQRKKQ